MDKVSIKALLQQLVQDVASDRFGAVMERELTLNRILEADYLKKVRPEFFFTITTALNSTVIHFNCYTTSHQSHTLYHQSSLKGHNIDLDYIPFYLFGEFCNLVAGGVKSSLTECFSFLNRRPYYIGSAEKFPWEEESSWPNHHRDFFSLQDQTGPILCSSHISIMDEDYRPLAKNMKRKSLETIPLIKGGEIDLL